MRSSLLWLAVCVTLIPGCNQAQKESVSEPPPGEPVAQGPHPNESKWEPDTAKASFPPGSRWVKLNNNLVMVGPGPNGLWVRLPEDAEVAPWGLGNAPDMYPTGKSAKDYNLPQVVKVGNDAQIVVQLYRGDAEHPANLEEESRKKHESMSRFVMRPWVGIGLKAPTGGMIWVEYPGIELRLMVSGKTEAGLARAEAVAHCIVSSIRVDPQARPVDYFPGAGEEENRPVPPENEIVMSKGMKIKATTPVGMIEIEAGEGCERSYTWEGATRSVIMGPRGERWHGSLGLAYPGPGNHWQEHNGITRGVLEEGQQHFSSEKEALAWIKERGFVKPVYRKDGLVVGWSKVLERHQLNVEVWQIYIKGKKPKKLPGANDAAIQVAMPMP